MAISNRTRHKIGLHKGTPEAPEDARLAAALGVQGSTMIIEDRVELSKAEQDLLQSRALTIEDDPWNQLPNERKVNLIKHAYDPVQLTNLTIQNNALGQCIDAMEVNIDGSGYDIERKDGKLVEESEKGSVTGPLKEFFDSAFVNESFTSIRRKLRRDAEATGNAYMEVIRNGAGEVTLVGHLDAKLVRMVKLDDPVEVQKEITRGGVTQTVRMLVRERRYAQLIGNKVRYFREFGSSRDINADTGEWLGEAKKPSVPQFKATNDQDKQSKDGEDPVHMSAPPGGKESSGEGKESSGPVDLERERKKRIAAFKADRSELRDTYKTQPTPEFGTGPRVEEDPSKRPETPTEPASVGTEIIHYRVKPDVTTPYGVPRWVNQIPSVLGSRKAEELNLEYFNHGGLPPVMIFLQGGQLAPAAKTALNQYLSGEAKGKMRGVVADVYATGGDLTSNSQVKVSVERFGGDRLNDSMFEGYDERCAGRVRSAFRLPPLFTGDTQDYNFATAYASYVVAEAQVFKPERELFDEIINNTIMREMAPDYLYRSLPLTVHDVAVQLQALTLLKDVSDTESFVDEVNEVAGLNVSFQDPMDNPMNPMFGGGLPGQDNPFGGEDQDNPFTNKGRDEPPFAQDEKSGKRPNPFAQTKTKMRQPVKGGPTTPKPAKPMPSRFAKVEYERIMKLGDQSFLQLAEDWAAHLAGDRTFEAPTVNFMKAVIDGFNPQVRKLFNAYVGTKLAPGAKYDPDGVSDLIACAGNCLND